MRRRLEGIDVVLTLSPVTVSAAGFKIDTCHIPRSEVRVEGRKSSLSSSFHAVRMGALRGWRGGRMVRGEQSPGSPGASPPEGEGLSHVNRAFATDTSRSAWTVTPTLTRPFSSRM